MSFYIKCVGTAGWVTLVAVASVAAHEDDPKTHDRIPRYEGPGFRRAEWIRDGGDELALPAFASDGIVLRSWLPLPEFGADANGNDCWGYVSPSGREYALMGLERGTGFVEITDPDDAQIIAVKSGPISLWRDIKVYQQYAYAVSEGGSGIQVFDLGDIDNGIVSLVNTVTLGGSTASHNVAIDEDSGFLYRCGGGGNGLRIYDLADPVNPTFVGSWADRYVHDAQIVTFPARPGEGPDREIAFCCGGLNGGWTDTSLMILDVTDKQDIQVLSITPYDDSGYSHQGWLSPDRRYFYLGDEMDESSGLTSVTLTRVFNVQNPSNPFLINTFTNNNTAIDHNIATKDNLIFEANYRSGLRVFDATDPISPVEIAFYDTFPGSDSTSFNGLWNSYPYFPSGTVIGSDLERGLFVWTVSPPPFDAPVTAPFPHDRPKNRYLSFTPLNETGRVAFQVELTALELGSCNGNGARCRLDRGNDDCSVCSLSGNPCLNEGACDGSETCEPTGEVCVNDHHGSIGRTWWLSAPDENGVCRLVSETYRHFQKNWPEVVHVSDCEVVPRATYSVRAYNETDFSDALLIQTVAKPGSAYWADAVGSFNTFCSGDPSAAICGHVGDPQCPAGESCLGAFPPADGAVNFDDISAALRLFESPVGFVLPDATWVDIHGYNGVAAWSDPPNFIANLADVQFTVLAFEGAPYPFADPSLCPDDAP